MGDIADDLTEQGEDVWFDHLAGHTQFPSDYCPYCEEEYEKIERDKLCQRKKTIRYRKSC